MGKAFRDQLKWPEIIVGTIIAAVFVTISLASIADYPLPICDEVQHITVSHVFMDRGRFAVDYRDNLAYFNENLPSLGRIYLITKGLLLELFGYNYVIGRVYSLLGAVAAGWFTYCVGWKLFNPLTGLVSAIIYFASNTLFLFSHYGRPDIWTSAAAIGLFYYYLIIHERPSRVRYLFLGLFGAFAAEFHLNIIWFILPIAGVAVYHNYSTGEGRRYLLLAALGGVLATAMIVAARLLPDPHISLEHLKFISEFNSLDDPFSARFFREIYFFYLNLYVKNVDYTVLLMTAYFIGALIYGASTWQRYSSRLILYMWGSSMLGFLIFQPHKNPYYSLLWEPYISLIIGVLLIALARRLYARLKSPSSLAPFWLTLMLASPLLVLNLVTQVWLAYKFSPRDYPAYVAQIKDMVPPGVHVMGNMTLAPEFYGRNRFTIDSYLDDCVTLGNCPDASEETTRQALQDYLQVEYIIYDGGISCGGGRLALSYALERYIQTQCHLQGEIIDPWFGAGGENIQGYPTRIYSCAIVKE